MRDPRPRATAHTFVAGPDGLEYLVFGTRHPVELGWLPRSGAVRLGHPWVEGRDDDPWDAEAEVAPLAMAHPAPRPPNILDVDEVEHESWENRMATVPLATHARSDRAGLHWWKIAAGSSPGPRPSSSGRRRAATATRRRRSGFGHATSSRGRHADLARRSQTGIRTLLGDRDGLTRPGCSAGSHSSSAAWLADDVALGECVERATRYAASLP